jgi:hypothetical protein
MDFLLFDLIMSFIGWSVLIVRFRSHKKAKEFVEDKFQGLWRVAGTAYFLNFIAGAGALLLLIFLIAIIFKTIFSDSATFPDV